MDAIAPIRVSAVHDPGEGRGLLNALLHRARRHAFLLGCVAVTLVVLLPVFHPGFVLRYDLLFVPQRHLSLALLGVTEEPPRQVPIEALVALSSSIVPAALLEKLLLAATFVLGAFGAGRLVPTEKTGPRLVAGLLYVWNPFVYERLSIGHWSLLLAYAALPWVARVALDLRSGRDAATWARMGLWLAAASISNPYGGVMAALLSLAIVCGPPWRGTNWNQRARNTFGLIGLAVVVSLPWLVPAVLRPDPLPSSLDGLRWFAPRSDSPLGTIGSVLSLGGIWNTFLAPPIRRGWAWIPSFATVAGLCVFGWFWLRRSRPHMVTLVLAGLLGVGLALGIHLPLLGGWYRWVALNAPGGGLLRDSQKFVGLLALTYAVGLGSVLTSWGESLRASEVGPSRSLGPPRSVLLTLALAALVVSVVPTMTWGLGGRLWTVPYPKEWIDARKVMAVDDEPGKVLVLPWHPHLPLGWNGKQVTLNPARTFFTRETIVSDRLELLRGTLPSETATGAAADAMLHDEQPLSTVMRTLGARYLLLLKEADFQRYADRVDRLELALNGPTLALYKLTGRLESPARHAPSASFVITGDIVSAGALLLMVGVAVRGRRHEETQPTSLRPRDGAGILQPVKGGRS